MGYRICGRLCLCVCPCVTQFFALTVINQQVDKEYNNDDGKGPMRCQGIRRGGKRSLEVKRLGE